MVKFTATLLALSAAATLVLGYSEDACYYTHSDKGRCVYKCNDKACNKYGTWNRDRFHHDMTGKGYHCNKNGYDSVSCWKPHDSGDCRSHNWSCSYNKKNHHKRGYDEHEKDWDKDHHDKDWDNHHHGKDWDKDHHDKDWDNHHHGKDWDNHHHGKDWDHGKDYGKEHH